MRASGEVFLRICGPGDTESRVPGKTRVFGCVEAVPVALAESFPGLWLPDSAAGAAAGAGDGDIFPVLCGPGRLWKALFPPWEGETVPKRLVFTVVPPAKWTLDFDCALERPKDWLAFWLD